MDKHTATELAYKNGYIAGYKAAFEHITKDLIDRQLAKEEILSWATVINNPKFLSKDDAMYILDTLPSEIEFRESEYEDEI